MVCREIVDICVEYFGEGVVGVFEFVGSEIVEDGVVVFLFEGGGEFVLVVDVVGGVEGGDFLVGDVVVDGCGGCDKGVVEFGGDVVEVLLLYCEGE